MGNLIDRINQRHRILRNPVADDLALISDRTTGHDPWPYSPPDGDKFLERIATSDDVYSAINLRARLVSGLTLKVYRGTGSSRKEVTTGPAYDLLRHVNPFWTPRRLYRMDEWAMGLWGETFWAIEKDQNGIPAEIWWLKPSRVRVVPDAENYIRGFLYFPSNGGPAIPFMPDEVIWYRYPNPWDEFSPLSPLMAAQLAAQTSAAMMSSNKSLFSKGLQIGGFVIPPSEVKSFTPEQANDVERFLETRFRGPENAHRWAVLRFEAQFKSAEITPKDAEFSNGLNITMRRICNVYGIPSPLLNDLEHATLANAEVFHSILWSDGLVPDVELRAEEITEQLLPMFPGRPLHAEFDLTKVPALQESATSVWDRQRQQIESGGLTINEWRESIGLPPVKWGDSWWAPVNKSAVNGPTKPAPAPAPTDPQQQDVPADQADEMMAMLDLQQLEFRHGRLALNGHKVNGHRRVRHE